MLLDLWRMLAVDLMLQDMHKWLRRLRGKDDEYFLLQWVLALFHFGAAPVFVERRGRNEHRYARFEFESVFGFPVELKFCL